MKKLYLKAPPQTALSSPLRVFDLSSRSWLQKFLPLTLIAIGTFLVVFVTAPILTYELVSAPALKPAKLLSPLPDSAPSLATNLGPQVKGTAVVSQAQEAPDYTQVSTWFPSAAPQARVSKITHYTIDIPKLNIKNATVTIGGEDLKQSLIHYGGTANPGEFGTPVIFGHSILRQFYNPSETNPRRYMSIFSTIMTLEDGDQIFVNYDGIKYTYTVRRKYQVEPSQVEVLAQRYDQKTLRLITCVPEGTYLHRGVIEAVLQPPSTI